MQTGKWTWKYEAASGISWKMWPTRQRNNKFFFIFHCFLLFFLSLRFSINIGATERSYNKTSNSFSLLCFCFACTTFVWLIKKRLENKTYTLCSGRVNNSVGGFQWAGRGVWRGREAAKRLRARNATFDSAAASPPFTFSLPLLCSHVLRVNFELV